MNLHENKELFRDAIIATSQFKKIPEIYIEKDYWVTLALKSIFQSEIGRYSIFKGGTALAKCNNIIDRFSEDIDIVLLKSEAESSNQLKTRLKRISKAVEKILPEVQENGITNKKGMIRKTAHQYEKVFSGHLGQVRNNIIVEATWLGSFEPYEKGIVNSFINEMIENTNQLDLLDKYNLNAFEVNVLSPKRTLCEKIMSLVRFSFTDDPITDLNNKIRHIYDLHMLLKDESVLSFFNSEEFEVLFLQVASDDLISFKTNNKWLANHPKTAIIFSDYESVWEKLKTTYFSDFKGLVYGELPDEKEILRSLQKIKHRIETVNWKIKL